MRVVKDIFKVQPLQLDTVELVPGSSIEGTIGKAFDVVGDDLAELITLSANTLPMLDGIYEIVVTVVGGTGTGKYKVVNAETGWESAELTTSNTANASVISGVSIKLATTEGTKKDDSASFEVIGDQTYIIPGTVLGKIATGTNLGKWRPVRSTDNIATDFTQFRVAASFQETDKKKTVLPIGYESNLSSVFTIDVVVYGQIFESACNAINLNALSAVAPVDAEKGIFAIEITTLPTAGDKLTLCGVDFTFGVGEGDVAIEASIAAQATTLVTALKANATIGALFTIVALDTSILLTEKATKEGISGFEVTVTRAEGTGALVVTSATLSPGVAGVVGGLSLKEKMPFYAWL